jgi:hypothetical protein
MSQAIDVLDSLSQRNERTKADAARRYAEIIRNGGPTPDDAEEAAELIAALGFARDEVRADIEAVAALKRAEADAGQTSNAEVARLRADKLAAQEALRDWRASLQDKERELNNAIADADVALRRAEEPRDEARRLELAIRRDHPRLNPGSPRAQIAAPIPGTTRYLQGHASLQAFVDASARPVAAADAGE